MLEESLFVGDVSLRIWCKWRMEPSCRKLSALEMMIGKMVGRLGCIPKVNLLARCSRVLPKEDVLLTSRSRCLHRHLDLVLSPLLMLMLMLLLLLVKHVVLIEDAGGHITHVTNANLLTVANELASRLFKPRIHMIATEPLAWQLDLTCVFGLYIPDFHDVKLRVINAALIVYVIDDTCLWFNHGFWQWLILLLLLLPYFSLAHFCQKIYWRLSSSRCLLLNQWLLNSLHDSTTLNRPTDRELASVVRDRILLSTSI